MLSAVYAFYAGIDDCIVKKKECCAQYPFITRRSGTSNAASCHAAPRNRGGAADRPSWGDGGGGDNNDDDDDGVCAAERMGACARRPEFNGRHRT